MNPSRPMRYALPRQRESLFADLRRLGYQPEPAHTRNDVYLYFDTQAGCLWAKGLSLRFCSADSTWQLQRGNRIVNQQSGGSDHPPEGGTLARRLRRLTKGKILLPYLNAALEESHHSLHSPSSAPIAMMVQSWRFEPPPIAQPDEAAAEAATTILTLYEEREGAPVQAPPQLLYFLGLLQDRLGLVPALESILETGVKACDMALPGAPLPPQLRVDPADSFAGMADKVLRAQAYLMRANTPGTIMDLDAEFLHDLRVATRRARFALRLFHDIYGKERCDALREELAWIAGLLGEVRDLDVFFARLDAQMERISADEETSDQILAVLAHNRALALEVLRPALRSQRYRSLLHSMESLGRSIGPESGQRTAGMEGAAQIERAMKKIGRWSKREAEVLQAEELHRIRILFKRLRYTCEFFKPFFPQKLSGLIKRTVAFQDCLGQHQDAWVAMENLRHLAEGGGQLPLLAVGSLLQVQREIASGQRAHFIGMWKELPELLRSLQRLLKEAGASIEESV